MEMHTKSELASRTEREALDKGQY